jgi:hypothetical protein
MQVHDPDFILEVEATLSKLKFACGEADTFERSLIPQGAVLVKKTQRWSQLPPSMTLIEESQLPFMLRTAIRVSAKCHERANFERLTTVEKILLRGPHNNTSERPIPEVFEVVQLAPKYALPAGTEIGPGVFILARPHWLHTPLWVEVIM